MRRAVQRDLMPRRRDVRHKGPDIFALASCAQTKKVAGTCSLSRISRIGRVFLLGPSSKVRQTILGSAVSPVAADTAKQSLGAVGLGVLPVVQLVNDAA